MSTTVVKVEKKADVARAANTGAEVLKQGGLVGFPTETVYGIAAVTTNPETMSRLRKLKSRPKDPFTVHLSAPGEVERYVAKVPELAQRLIDRAWPGPISLVIPTGGKLADAKLQKMGMHKALCKDGRIGLRCPDEPIAQAMLGKVPDPVVAPSANLSGSPSPRSGQEVLSSLDDRIDLLIDSGPTRHGLDSTVVRCDHRGWRIIRGGIYDEKAIRRILHRKFLFVCTGNTCRSPIAAGLVGKMLSDRLKCDVSRLDEHGVEIRSAGVVAFDGHGPTPEAVLASRQWGADISKHRSTRLTPELINDADLIFCMMDFHVDAVRRMVPSGAGKVFRLDPEGAVPDPIGGGVEVYVRAAEQIQHALEAHLEKDF